MPRKSDIWWRESRGQYYVWVGDKQVPLGADEAEARRQFHSMAAQRPGEKTIPGLSPTVESVIDQFLVWVDANRSAGTLDFYARRLQSFVDWLPDQRLTVAGLKPNHLQKWVDEYRSKKKGPLSPGGKRSRIMAVQTACNWAVEQGIIDRSPVARVRKPRQGRRENVVSPEEWVTLMGFVKTPALRDLLTMAWETGARAQEVMRVEARNVDFAGKKWVFEIENSKGKKRMRVVHLTDDALALCRRLADRHPKGPLLRNSKGRPWNPNAASCALARLAKHFGRKIAPTDIRHSFATRMLKAGVDPITVSALMGHADTGMLARVYAHVHGDSKHLRDALRKGSGA